MAIKQRSGFSSLGLLRRVKYVNVNTYQIARYVDTIHTKHQKYCTVLVGICERVTGVAPHTTNTRHKSVRFLYLHSAPKKTASSSIRTVRGSTQGAGEKESPVSR